MLRQSTLASGLAGSIHISDQPGPFAPIHDPTRVNERHAGKQILLEQGTQVFHAGLIEGGQKAGECRAGRQAGAAKESHEYIGKRPQTVVKGSQCQLPRQRIADENHQKIDQLSPVPIRARAKRTRSVMAARRPVWVRI